MKVYRSRKSGLAIRESYDRLLAFWSCETKERDVATAYGTTHVIECGKAESLPLVLFHGVGDDSALMWMRRSFSLSRTVCPVDAHVRVAVDAFSDKSPYASPAFPNGKNALNHSTIFPFGNYFV